MREKDEIHVGQLFLLIACFIWGSSSVLNKIALADIPLFMYTGLRFLIGSSILGFVYINKLKKMDFEDLKIGIVLGVILFFALTVRSPSN